MTSTTTRKVFLIVLITFIFSIILFSSIDSDKKQVNEPTPQPPVTNITDNILYEGEFKIAYVSGRARLGTRQGKINVYDKNEKLVWEYYHGDDNLSKPVVKNNVVYIFTEPAGAVALRLNSGEILWKQQFPNDLIHSSYTIPVFTDDNNIIVEANKNIYALNSENGNILWLWPNKENYFFSTVQLMDNIAFIYSRSNSTSYIYLAAIESNNGTLLWEQKELVSKDYWTMEFKGDNVCIKEKNDSLCYHKKTGTRQFMPL